MSDFDGVENEPETPGEQQRSTWAGALHFDLPIGDLGSLPGRPDLGAMMGKVADLAEHGASMAMDVASSVPGVAWEVTKVVAEGAGSVLEGVGQLLEGLDGFDISP